MIKIEEIQNNKDFVGKFWVLRKYNGITYSIRFFYKIHENNEILYYQIGQDNNKIYYSISIKNLKETFNSDIDLLI